ncbi:hypothetical protein GCM10010261_41480 [Streptomyces pilosus]|nr:hypothetical protein GCM10010261_41480 [Streptomyces pilosus]
MCEPGRRDTRHHAGAPAPRPTDAGGTRPAPDRRRGHPPRARPARRDRRWHGDRGAPAPAYDAVCEPGREGDRAAPSGGMSPDGGAVVAGQGQAERLRDVVFFAGDFFAGVFFVVALAVLFVVAFFSA